MVRIALDVDGVLADVVQSWLVYNNSQANRSKLTKQQMTSWNFWSAYNVNRYDFYDELNACWEDWMSIPTTESDLSASTKLLSDLGQVDIVTARVQSTDSFVKEWLAHHHIHFDNYVSVIDGPMKADLDYDVFIDDSPLNAQKFIEKGKKMLLYTQPWNLHISDDNNNSNNTIHRVDDLPQAIKQIKLFGSS